MPVFDHAMRSGLCAHEPPALVGINGRVGKLFATPVCSQAVLHLVMKQLLLYYSRFVVVVEKRYVPSRARKRFVAGWAARLTPQPG